MNAFYLTMSSAVRGAGTYLVYVRWTTKHGRKQGNEISLFIGHFRSSNNAKCAIVVR